VPEAESSGLDSKIGYKPEELKVTTEESEVSEEGKKIFDKISKDISQNFKVKTTKPDTTTETNDESKKAEPEVKINTKTKEDLLTEIKAQNTWLK